MKNRRSTTFDTRDLGIMLFIALAIVLLASLAQAQTVSRWALGRPALLIDMPAQPSGGGVAWAEKPAYSIFPSAWSAEGGGVRLEIARIYTSQPPADLLASVGQKTGGNMAPTGKGKISGREFVNSTSANRITVVIGSDGGVLGGASWVAMATFKDQAGRTLAVQLLDSIKVEREGARHWALRSLGPTFLAAEMPFELTPQVKAGEANISRYESSFDGMDIRVTRQTPSEGMVFERENTLKDIMEGERTMPGVTEFTVSREKYKLGDREGDLIVKNFKRGYRKYRVYEIAFIEKRTALTASIQIDPSRTDHQNTTERILRSMKSTVNSIYGWNTYAIGKDGLFVDLPVAPSAPRQQNAVTIYESNTPLAMAEIRELTVGFPSAHSPDFAAKQYFEMQQAINPKANFVLEGIDKLLIDGLEARLVRSTWKNGENTNYRRILTIYGYEKQWIIDMLAAKDTFEYMERVMQSVRVRVNSPGAVRQSFGTMGVSFNVKSRLETKVTQNPADPDFAREESAMAFDGKAMLSVYEMEFKSQSVEPTADRGTLFMSSFLNGLARRSGLKLSAKLRDSFPVNIDGVAGLHVIFDVTSDRAGENTVIQGDMILLGQDKKLWTVTVITNYEGGLEARADRARILNSLRVGM